MTVRNFFRVACFPQAPPELLDEYDARLGRPQHQYHIRLWNVDALIENID